MSSSSLWEKGAALELLAKMGGEQEYLSIERVRRRRLEEKTTSKKDLFRSPPRATDATRQSKTRPFIDDSK